MSSGRGAVRGEFCRQRGLAVRPRGSRRLIVEEAPQSAPLVPAEDTAQELQDRRESAADLLERQWVDYMEF